MYIYIYCIEVDSGLKVAFNAFICVVLISCQPLIKLMIYSYSASEFSKSNTTHTHTRVLVQPSHNLTLLPTSIFFVSFRLTFPTVPPWYHRPQITHVQKWSDVYYSLSSSSRIRNIRGVYEEF